MDIEALYVIVDNKFGKYIAEWAEEREINVVPTAQRNSELSELVDAVVVFHENHNFSKENDETQQVLAKENRAVHKVDLKGTLSATHSNFQMWLERNRPEKLLFIGDDAVIKNENLPVFLGDIEY